MGCSKSSFMKEVYSINTYIKIKEKIKISKKNPDFKPQGAIKKQIKSKICKKKEGNNKEQGRNKWKRD